MIIYSRTVCGKCMLLKSELTAKGESYREINIDHDEAARALMQEKGFMSVPILEKDGEFKTFDEAMKELDGI